MRAIIRRYAGDFWLVTGIAAIGVLTAGYLLLHQTARIRLPLIDQQPFHMSAAFSNARGVLPGQGQSVRIAGVQVGLISGDRLDNGVAVVSFDIQPRYRHLIHSDARALLRPQTGLDDMFVELDPGTADAPPMRNGGEVPVANTAPDVNPDEVLSTLDADTRAYLQLLVNGAGKGLAGRGDDLRQILIRYAPLHRSLAELTTAIAQRHVELARLVHNYSALMNELGDRPQQLVQLVAASNTVLGAFAAQNQNISAAVGKLPGTLSQTTSTLTKVSALSHALPPALNALQAPLRQLNATNAAVLPLARAGTPLLARDVRPFVRVARPYVRNLRPAAKGLATATPDLTSGFHEFNRLFNMGAYNNQHAGNSQDYLFWLAWATQNAVSLFSTSDATGPFRRSELLATCDTWQSIFGGNPALLSLLGLDPLLRDPTLCNQSHP